VLITALIVVLIFSIIVSLLFYYQRKSDILLKIIKNSRKEAFPRFSRNVPEMNYPNSSDSTINIDADVNLPSMNTSISNINSSFQNGPPNVSFLNSSNNSFMKDNNHKNSYILPQTTDISILPPFLNDTSITSKPLDDDSVVPQISCHSFHIPRETIDVSKFLLDPSLQQSSFLSGNSSLNVNNNVKTSFDKFKNSSSNESKNILSKLDFSPRDSSLNCTSVDTSVKNITVYPVETEFTSNLSNSNTNQFSSTHLNNKNQVGCRKSNSYTHPPRDSSLIAIKSKDDIKAAQMKRTSKSLYGKPPIYHSYDADNENINNTRSNDISEQNNEKRVLSNRPARVSSLISDNSNMNSEQVMSQLISNCILLDNYNKVHEHQQNESKSNSSLKENNFSTSSTTSISEDSSETAVDTKKNLITNISGEISTY